MTTLSIHTPIGFIGAGAVGGTLAVALAQAGYRVTAIGQPHLGVRARPGRTRGRVHGLCHGPTGRLGL
jgi:prephenate dehydrogenase